MNTTGYVQVADENGNFPEVDLNGVITTTNTDDTSVWIDASDNPLNNGDISLKSSSLGYSKMLSPDIVETNYVINNGFHDNRKQRRMRDKKRKG
jgi:hypothetical protein